MFIGISTKCKFSFGAHTINRPNLVMGKVKEEENHRRWEKDGITITRFSGSHIFSKKKSLAKLACTKGNRWYHE